MKHNTIYYLLLIIVIGLCNSCKKEPENCIITGQLINCDGTPYANKSIKFAKSIYFSYQNYFSDEPIYTDSKGYFEFQYQKIDDELGDYELIIDSTTIVRNLNLGHNFRLNTIQINPSIKNVYKLNVENPYDSNYELYLDINGLTFLMKGPFRDTILGQFNFGVLPYDAMSNIQPYIPISTYISKIRPSMTDSTIYNRQYLTPNFCSQTPDTILVIVK